MKKEKFKSKKSDTKTAQTKTKQAKRSKVKIAIGLVPQTAKNKIEKPKKSQPEKLKNNAKPIQIVDIKSTDLSNQIFNVSAAPEPVGAYPHARRMGDFLFLSGVGPRNRGSSEIPGVHKNVRNKILSYDIEAQTRSVIANIKMILQAAGAKFSDIVDVQVYLTDMKKDFAQFNAIYAEYFKGIQATRTTIQVGALPTPIAVEFKVVAYLGQELP